jgi:hypothetical protein
MSTIAHRVGEMVRNADDDKRVKWFMRACGYIARSRGSPLSAVALAQADRALPPIIDFLKAAVTLKTAVTAGDTTNQSELAPYRLLADPYIASVRSVSAFDAVLPFAANVPPHVNVTIVSGGATAATTGQGAPKVVTKLTFSTQQVSEFKTAAIIAGTQELFTVGNVNALQNELTNSIVAALDSAFVARIISGIAVSASNGGTSLGILADLYTLLAGLTLQANSKVFILTSSDICKAWSVHTTTQGELLFPSLTPTGGTVQGITVIPTEGVSGQLVAVDASQLIMASSLLEVSSSREAMLNMDSTPDSPPTPATPYLSLWQQNWLALRAERVWAAERARGGAVSVISPVSYSGNSPA